MVSKINITEFIERVKRNTKLGNPKIKGTPFALISRAGESDNFFLEHTLNQNLYLPKMQLFFQHHILFQVKLIQKMILKLRLFMKLSLLELVIIG